jgi:hypothetical protein
MQIRLAWVGAEFNFKPLAALQARAQAFLRKNLHRAAQGKADLFLCRHGCSFVFCYNYNTGDNAFVIALVVF